MKSRGLLHSSSTVLDNSYFNGASDTKSFWGMVKKIFSVDEDSDSWELMQNATQELFIPRLLD